LKDSFLTHTPHVAFRDGPTDNNRILGEENYAIDVHVDDSTRSSVMDFRLASHIPIGLLDRAEREGPQFATHHEISIASR